MNFSRLSELAQRESRHKIFGVVVGVVTNNKTEDGQYQVKVKFPWLPGENGTEDESHWCRVATFMAGNARGAFFLPEVDDEVLVAFEHGEISRPFVIGALWNGKDAAIYDNKSGDNGDGKNNVRGFKSRCGHLLEFGDKAGEEKITLKSKGNASIIIDDKAKTIAITGQSGSDKIVIDSQNNKITIETKDLEIKTTANIKMEAQAKITTQSTSDTELTSNANFKATSQANMDLKCQASGSFQASGQLVLKGAVVNIN